MLFSPPRVPCARWEEPLSVILEDDWEKGFFCRDKAMEHTYYIICAVHHQWALKPKNKVEDASHRLLYVYFLK